MRRQILLFATLLCVKNVSGVLAAASQPAFVISDLGHDYSFLGFDFYSFTAAGINNFGTVGGQETARGSKYLNESSVRWDANLMTTVAYGHFVFFAPFGGPTGGTNFFTRGISDSGELVGSATGSGPILMDVKFPGGFTLLAGISDNGVATAMNSQGQVVGNLQMPPPPGISVRSLYLECGITDQNWSIKSRRKLDRHGN